MYYKHTKIKSLSKVVKLIKYFRNYTIVDIGSNINLGGIMIWFIIVELVIFSSCFLYYNKLKKEGKTSKAIKLCIRIAIFLEFASLVTLTADIEVSFGYSILTFIFCFLFLYYIKKENNKEKSIRKITKISYSNNNQTKEIQNNNELEEFNKNIKENFSDDYLNSKLEDGLTIKEHMQQGYNKIIKDEKNSSNPKFNRTFEEDELSYEFSQEYSQDIDKLEKIIYEGMNFNESDLNEIKQSIYKCNKSIQAYYELKKFCYKHKGGKIYFQDMWEFCHNSKNDCFEYVEQLYDTKKYLQDLYVKEKRPNSKMGWNSSFFDKF